MTAAAGGSSATAANPWAQQAGTQARPKQGQASSIPSNVTPSNVTPINGGQPSQIQNPWLAASNGQYDPDHFYTRATNVHDHSDRVSFKIRPDLLAAMRDLISDKALAPMYRTPDDFIRDAVVHRFHYLTGLILDPEWRDAQIPLMQQIEAERHIEEIKRDQANWAYLQREAKEALAMYVDKEDWEGLLGAVDRLTMVIEFRADSKWKRELERLLSEYRDKVPGEAIAAIQQRREIEQGTQSLPFTD